MSPKCLDMWIHAWLCMFVSHWWHCRVGVRVEARTQSIQRTFTLKRSFVCLFRTGGSQDSGMEHVKKPLAFAMGGPTPTYPSRAAASVGLGQSSVDDGTALVEEQDQQAVRVPHLKPKHVDEARSFVEQFGVDR